MFFHLAWELINGNRPIFISIHFFKEELDLIFGDVGVNVPQKIAKLSKI